MKISALETILLILVRTLFTKRAYLNQTSKLLPKCYIEIAGKN